MFYSITDSEGFSDRLLGQNPAIKVIVLSVHSQRNIVSEILRARAAGYVLKTYLFDELSKALRSVAKNGYYLSPPIADVVVDEYLSGLGMDKERERYRLTTFERRVLQLVAEG